MECFFEHTLSHGMFVFMQHMNAVYLCRRQGGGDSVNTVRQVWCRHRIRSALFASKGGPLPSLVAEAASAVHIVPAKGGLQGIRQMVQP
jgi:hypothetical protein